AGPRDVLLTLPPVPHQQPEQRMQDDPREQPPAGGVRIAGRRLGSAASGAHGVSLLVRALGCRGRIKTMTDNGLTTWSVLMPVKVLAQAKSRLAGLAGLAGPRRGEFALALASDTVTAVLGSDAVARVIVITDDQAAAAALGALGALVVPDEPRAGLNAALRHGAGFA